MNFLTERDEIPRYDGYQKIGMNLTLKKSDYIFIYKTYWC